MKERLMAIVVEGKKSRVYLNPDMESEKLARSAEPWWKPDCKFPLKHRNFQTPIYGMPNVGDIFTPRQLVALTTFSDLVLEAREKAISDARAAGWPDDGIGLNDGGTGATAYGDAVAVYLAFGVSRQANRLSNICFWDPGGEKVQQVFARQAIPMTWDFTEANPFSQSTGNFLGQLGYLSKVLETSTTTNYKAFAIENDSIRGLANTSQHPIISTDPPYYDNVGYADLSDFFYVWLRRPLIAIFPQIFSTLLVPKASELIASPYRHGGKLEAETFFSQGMAGVLKNMALKSNEKFPLTIYYAFKQSDEVESGTLSTGWHTFLDAAINAGFSILGTWPMRTELIGNLKKRTNALASSIVLVCRKRPLDSPSISRKQFLRELDESLPEAIETMIGGKGGLSPVAPVDLAQAAIGPGMAVYSQYSDVLNADGSPMPVREALIQINRSIDEYFTKTEGHMDPDTRFCIGWFEQYGYNEGPFGEADVLARAKVTSVDGVVASGTIQAGAGKVRLLKYSEYPTEWDPTKDRKLSVWEALHHLIRALQTGEKRTGELLAKMPDKSDAIRQLAYRLYTYCERKGWAEEARQYNELIASWSGIVNVTITLGGAQTQDELGLQ
jgi:putative DNA methylase